MNNLEFTGKLIYKGDVQSGVSASGKEWSKTSFVIEDDAQYPNSMLFEAFNKASLLTNLSVGSEVKVRYNALAREYNGKYYNTLSMYSIEILNKVDDRDIETMAKDNYIPPEESEQDDLPF
jgi:hypothetical protein